jgi:hypothetical protein
MAVFECRNHDETFIRVNVGDETFCQACKDDDAESLYRNEEAERVYREHLAESRAEQRRFEESRTRTISPREWLSACCDAPPVDAGGIRLDESTVGLGGPTGFCTRCHSSSVFTI